MTEIINTNEVSTKKKWKILIADDDEDVRLITQLVLKSIEFEGCPLEFFFAANSQDVVTQMKLNPDIGVILLDMIMDSANAGFFAVEQIRNHLKNQQVRIIMRTGKNCDELDELDFFHHDINGFCEKTISAKQLTFTVVGELRSYRDIIRETKKGVLNQPSGHCLVT